MGKKSELDNITLPVYELLKKETSSVYVASSGINNLSDEDIDVLKAGDIVEKVTGNQRHAYVVTYKEEKHGICLTYVDGSGYMETVSYDYVNGHWVYNSKDVTQAVTEDGVKGLIQADKDILSQIEREGTGPYTIKFPKNVLPLRINYLIAQPSTMYLYYFDYNSMKLIDRNGAVVQNSSISIENNHVVISGTIQQVNYIKDIDYILFENNTALLNTYYLFNPVTSGGTKLYKHNITLNNGNEITIISTKSSAYELSDFSSYAMGFNCLTILNQDNGTLISYLDYQSADLELELGSFGSQSTYYSNITSLNDTVTEL